MSINLKCAACGHQVPFEDGGMDTEAICPQCEVLLRRRSAEDEMAIPVSMALPDEFEPANLKTVPKHTREIIHRYQKNLNHRAVKTGDPLSDSNLVLAKAIEQLAEAISGQGFAGSKQEFSEEHEHHQSPEDSIPYSYGDEEVPVLNGITSKREKEAESDSEGRALPVGSPVLVRREAAAETHRYQRRAQVATDIKGAKQSGLSRWVENHPFVMMFIGLTLLITLVIMTTILMTSTENDPKDVNNSNSALTTEGLLDPDLKFAEGEARGFLNAIALKAAKPYIFRASAIGPKLERFYQPLPNPGDYTLEFTGRQKNANRAVYYYQVTSEEQSQPIVVLQENSVFKVFWEFGAGIGDISWQAFLDDEPSKPVLLRAFLQPNPVQDVRHSEQKWTSWKAENWDGSKSAQFFTKIGSPEDRRLKSAIEKHAVERKKSKWVMAQVRIKHDGTGIDPLIGSFESAEITEVPLGSWLPEEFVIGNTFYSEEGYLKGATKDRQGLQKQSGRYE